MKPDHPRSRRQRGISLIEALVAMMVMSFGTLAVLGVQATLRANGDLSKQRAEAVRIGQAAIETWRGYADLDGDAEGQVHYESIDDEETTEDGTNATYTVTRTVPDPSTDPRYRVVVIDVGWQDRAGNAQNIRLSSAIFGTPPELAGTLAIPATRSILGNPGGRHPAIPDAAVPQEGGTSRFTPPGAPAGVAWVFDNHTGFITQICADAVCIAASARLLAGFVVYAYAGTPNPELPDSPRLPGVEVEVVQTLPAAVAGTLGCYEDATPVSYTAYYCAVPLGVGDRWTGQSLLVGLAPLATSIADSDAADYRVCRYTRYRSHLTAPTQMKNSEHPLIYDQVTESLVNQNFLVIRAGDGTAATNCPADIEEADGGLPIDGTTWHHQPSS